MQKPGITQWVLIILLLTSIIVYPLIELIYQGGRATGWSTHFKVERFQCDIDSARIYPRQDNVWVLGLGDCESYKDAQFYDGTSWQGLDLDQHASYQVDQQGRLWRMTTDEGGNQPTAEEFAVMENGSWSEYASADILARMPVLIIPILSSIPPGNPGSFINDFPPQSNPCCGRPAWRSIMVRVGRYTTDGNTPELASERIWAP